MGYQIALTVNCHRAEDLAALPGVTLRVFHEGENYSIMTLTSDQGGHAYENVDRSHWAQTEALRVTVYYSKAGYVGGVLIANRDGSFTDGNDVVNYSYECEPVLLAAAAEVLPPPDVERGAD